MLCSELTNVNYLFYLYVLNCFVVSNSYSQLISI